MGADKSYALRDDDYTLLRDIVKDYPGLLPAAESLMGELRRRPRCWPSLMDALRSYALTNFALHDNHEQGLSAIRTVLDIYLEITEAPDNTDRQTGVHAVMFYLHKILLDGNREFTSYEPLLSACFRRINLLPPETFFYFVTAPHTLKRLGQRIAEKRSEGAELDAMNAILIRSFRDTYAYWLSQEDPAAWFDNSAELRELLQPVSHDNLKALDKLLQAAAESSPTDAPGCFANLLKLPGYSQIVTFYEDISGKLADAGNCMLEIAYLLKVLQSSGLASIHSDIIRELGRILPAIIKTEPLKNLQPLLTGLVDTLRQCFFTLPEATLDCMQTIGIAAYQRCDSALVEWFNQDLVSFGFQLPQVTGITDEWQVKSNRAHLKNIRVWLELIEQNPKWSKSLISALNINLRLGGVHINDTDLFQKDITRLLNSDIAPVYHFIKQLAKVFPAYFTTINAEGALREVSTAFDEAAGMQDQLAHFLRKHCHVESSSIIVDFMEAAIKFWLTQDKRALHDFLPGDIYAALETTDPYIDEMHALFTAIFRLADLKVIPDLLGIAEPDLCAMLQGEAASEREKQRACLAIRFYQLLWQKYRLGTHDIKEQLIHSTGQGLPPCDALTAVLDGNDLQIKLTATLDHIELLQQIILSPERFEAIEDIAHKRHIAAGIPSMYGRYLEKKFNALALTFRLEGYANILFEELIRTFNLQFITQATLRQIEEFARLFFRALKLDGISSHRLENMLELLSGAIEVRRFSSSQYIDIFRGLSEGVQDILGSYHTGMHKAMLRNIILQLGNKHILPKYRDGGDRSETDFINAVSERALREMVALSPGLQQLDVFISSILRTLREQAEQLGVAELDLLMSYDPKKIISSVHVPIQATKDRIHLGNKGYNLVKLASLSTPVPPGFIITTEVFRCMPAIIQFRYMKDHLMEQILRQIATVEETTGRKFGDPANPLLVSVRSGAAISMPGMMNSFLNVGLNEAIVQGLIRQTGRPWFAWDCYRRFLQCWGMFFGMERDAFDAVIDAFKLRYKVDRKLQFTEEQMMAVAFAYRDMISRHGIRIEDNPVAQLETAITLVFHSWDSRKANAYRQILGISEDWGTAVLVQAMVYGNLDKDSGAGVVFTRNPREVSGKVLLWGDFTMGAQGEDIVSGLVKTLPLSIEQKHSEDRTYDISLEELFPEIYTALLKLIRDLIYKEQWSAQEMEFTFEGKTADHLFILQTRDMAVPGHESITAFVPSEKLSENYLAGGIGVSGGALSGRVVFDLEDISAFRKEDDGPLILVRSDTVPDDIQYISAADGLLTARGGSTSHASIIAKRLGKTCVVGCNKLTVSEANKKCRIGRQDMQSGEFISIDGRSGSIYAGKNAVQEIKLLAE
jgi:pyruvate, orthophosphate dikinase